MSRFRALAVGIDAEVRSTVPEGSGLSSSAAFEVAVALALCDAAGLELGRRELALACQEAEHLATGSVVAIAPPSEAEAVAGAAADAYARRTGLEPTAFVCRAVTRAGPA